MTAHTTSKDGSDLTAKVETLALRHAALREEVQRAQTAEAFTRGRAELGEAGSHLRLSLSRVCVAAKNDADAKRKIALAYDYYSRFDNVFTGPGLVDNGCIRALPREQTVEELANNLIICPPAEMADRIAAYADLGVDEFIMNVNIGHSQAEALEAMQLFHEEVMPHFAQRKKLAVA